MSVEDAVLSYTINGAKLLGLDEKIGTLEVGKRADLIVLDQNIFELETNKIHKAKVVLTLMDGAVKYGELGN
ncbi:amidohydrolase family protein [Ruegeria atlantica]|uniref:amidohydrolase family protein n=1 Tax=Ruegeria atlantica TaxID=81569 RepID=UPI0024953966|nr:amidohydrolase family protein [Ruegeria atlantica]